MAQPELGMEQCQLIGIPIRRRKLDEPAVNRRSPIDNTIKIRQHKVRTDWNLDLPLFAHSGHCKDNRDPKAADERPKFPDRASGRSAEGGGDTRGG